MLKYVKFWNFFTISGCKKDGVDPNTNKTTKEIVIGNYWRFTNGSALRTNGTNPVDDTIVSFNPNYTLTITITPNTVNFEHTNYTIKDDSVNATLVFRVANRDDSLFYLTKINDNKDKLIGKKIESKFVFGTLWDRDTTDITLDIIKK